MLYKKNAIILLILFMCVEGLINFWPIQTVARNIFWPAAIVDPSTQTIHAQPSQPSTDGSTEAAFENSQIASFESPSPFNRDAADQFSISQQTETLAPPSPSPVETTSQKPQVLVTRTTVAQSTTSDPALTTQETPRPTSTVPAVTEPAVTAPSETTTATPPTESAPTSAGSFLEDIRNLTNQARIAEGLSPLSSTALLDQAAACRANEISISLSHTRPDGRPYYTVFSDFGIVVGSGAENFSSCTADAYTASEIVNSWLASPVHRSNLLNSSYTLTGLGIYVTAGQVYIVQLFAA